MNAAPEVGDKGLSEGAQAVGEGGDAGVEEGDGDIPFAPVKKREGGWKSLGSDKEIEEARDTSTRAPVRKGVENCVEEVLQNIGVLIISLPRLLSDIHKIAHFDS